MKKSFKAGMIAAALFAIAPMGVSMVNSSTTVHADKVVPLAEERSILFQRVGVELGTLII